MQWLIDICKEWVEEWFATYVGFVDRGDPAAEDFELADFTQDSNWHDLDLSSIVPENAKAVVLAVAIRNTRVGKYFFLRTKGNTNTTNKTQMRTQVGGLYFTGDYVVPLDATRTIEYLAIETDWTTLTLSVKGWWF